MTGEAVKLTLKPLVAYSVQADEYGCIRFARSGAQARREGANEMDIDWEAIVSCRRAPQFDALAPGPVPDEALWKSGWRFLCCQCECSATEDFGVWSGGQPYCEDCAPEAGRSAIASTGETK